MKVEEVLKTILKRPRELILDFTLQVDHSVGFAEFLWALSSSTTITRIDYHGVLDIYLSLFQKEQVIEALGQMKCLEELCFSYGVSIPPKALASAVRRATTLRVLNFGIGSRLNVTRQNSTDMKILANALRFHPSLEHFVWILRQDFDPDIAQALSTCPKLYHISLTESGLSSVSHGIDYVAASKSLRSLEVRTSFSWEKLSLLLDDSGINKDRAVRLANFSITHVPCRSDQQLTLKEVIALSNRIRDNKTLEVLSIGVKGYFTDEMGIVLANAMKQNRGNLRAIHLHSATRRNRYAASTDKLFQERAYKAFYDALHENHNLVLTIDVMHHAEKSQKVIDARSNVHILSKLNSLGRGKLRSADVSKDDWIKVLVQIDQDFLSDQVDEDDITDGGTLALSCIYSLVRMDPFSLIK